MNRPQPENNAAGVSGASVRIRAIDMLKLLALIGVVACHSALKTDILCWWSFPWWVRVFEMAVVVAIPGFFFASGYVLLGRRARCGYRYVIRKCVALLIASFVMGFLLLGYKFLSTDAPWFRFMPFVADMCNSIFLMNGTIGIFWFVGALIMVYLLYPLINLLYIYNRRLFATLALVFLVVMALCSSAYVLGNSEALWFEPPVPQPLRLWNWVGYFCLGGLMKAYPSLRCLGKWWVILLAAAATLILNHIGFENTGIRHFEYVYGTPAAVLLVMSVAAFLLRRDFSGHRFCFLDSMGVLFFPAFLLCDFVLELSAGCTGGLHPAVFLMVNFVLSLVIGLIGAWVLTRIPVVSRLLRL